MSLLPGLGNCWLKRDLPRTRILHTKMFLEVMACFVETSKKITLRQCCHRADTSITGRSSWSICRTGTPSAGACSARTLQASRGSRRSKSWSQSWTGTPPAGPSRATSWRRTTAPCRTRSGSGTQAAPRSGCCSPPRRAGSRGGPCWRSRAPATAGGAGASPSRCCWRRGCTPATSLCGASAAANGCCPSTTPRTASTTQSPNSARSGGAQTAASRGQTERSLPQRGWRSSSRPS
mmetsp:Transcript_36195/g.85871  ORF Transcript_36195/g.85871 Transcript_36195/m.85871 type:complete len:235 (-) Transcript_36195:755-1459(-)